MRHLLPKSVQSGADLSAQDALGLLQLRGQGVVELAFPDDVLGSVPESRPVELRGKPREHRAQVLQVIHHHAQLREGRGRFSRASLFKSLHHVCTHHVDGAGRVGLFRQEPDPSLQDVAVVHHNLAHVLQHTKRSWLVA